MLETLSPVYIGSGQEISKKEYIYDSSDKKVHIPDMKKDVYISYEKRTSQ